VNKTAEAVKCFCRDIQFGGLKRARQLPVGTALLDFSITFIPKCHSPPFLFGPISLFGISIFHFLLLVVAIKVAVVLLRFSRCVCVCV